MARAALDNLKLGVRSPSVGGRAGSPYRPSPSARLSPERVAPAGRQRPPREAQQQQRSRPRSAPPQRPAWVPGNGKQRDLRGAIAMEERFQSPSRSRAARKAETFSEFLQRQSDFVNKKEAKVKAAMQVRGATTSHCHQPLPSHAWATHLLFAY